MVVKRTPRSAPKQTTARRDTTAKKVSRTPTRLTAAQIAPHVKTLSNGQPRPKKRR